MKVTHHLPTLLISAFVVVACDRKEPAPNAEKKGPNELIAVLGKGGLKIEKAGSFQNEPPAEMNMELKVDGQEDIVAKRFPSPKMASDYCETQRACFTVEHWAVEAFVTAAKSPQWKQLLADTGQAPAPAAAPSTPTSPPAVAQPECATLEKCCAAGERPTTVEIACGAAKSGAAYADCAQNLRAVAAFTRTRARSCRADASNNLGATMDCSRGYRSDGRCMF
jgi:hypothetical protein